LNELIPIRADLILSAVRNFKPNLVIVDKKPVGIKKEFFGALNWIKKYLPATRVILGLRDILDEPEITIPVWEKNRYHDVIENYYDGVWIFGDPVVFDAVKEYCMPAATAQKVSYTGYLVKPQVGVDRLQIRTELGLNGGLFSVVMAGGGDDGFPIMKTYVETARCAGHQSHQFDSLLNTGPEMPKAEREQVADWCSNGLPLRCAEFSGEIENLLVAADVVVSMGGYNSTCEVLAYRKKAVIIPRIAPVKEQYIRAQRLAALGVINMIHPDELTPATMQRAIEKTARQNQMLAGL
jgi:predicted glycosyltransferase